MVIRDDNPTVFVKHKRLLGLKGDVPEDLYEISLGSASTVRSGDDITVVTYGRMVHEATSAAKTLATEGIECDVIDLRTLQPLDIDTVIASARRTNRVAVVHEAVRFGGLGGEIASQIAEEAFDYLDAPIERVGAPFSPVPFSPALESEWVPNAEMIGERIRALAAA